MPSFDDWFKRATGNYPFSYQRRFAVEGEIPELVDISTGLGKTADWERKDECPLFPLLRDLGFRGEKSFLPILWIEK